MASDQKFSDWYFTFSKAHNRTPSQEEIWNAALAQLAPEQGAQVVAAPGTPSSKWHGAGKPDPHAGHYDGERAALCMGSLTDDELANGAFMNYNAPFNLAGIVAGTHYSPIVWMTAVKDRIRWLSRALEKSIAASHEATPAATEVALAETNSTSFLIQIWGEDIDHPLTAIVSDWEGVRRFCVEHYTGSEDAKNLCGNILSTLKTEFDEHEAEETGKPYSEQWEIGGISIERVCDCTPRAAAFALPITAKLVDPPEVEIPRSIQKGIVK